jgi:GTP cyclohydrolase II
MTEDYTTHVRIAAHVPLPEGGSEFISFTGLPDSKEHIAIAYGTWRSTPIPLVRLHSECLTGDVFGSLKCDCGPQLHEAQHKCQEGAGIILYLRQEGRGIGLYNKLDAYAHQDRGADTWEANRLLGLPEEARDFTVAAQMLKAMNKTRIHLLSNNPEKRAQLESCGIEVVEMIPTSVFPNRHNHQYLSSKRDRGHALDLEQADAAQ